MPKSFGRGKILIKNFLSRHRNAPVLFGVGLFACFLLYYYLVAPALFLSIQSRMMPLKLRPIMAAVNRRDLKTLDFELKYFRGEVVRSKNAVDKMSAFSFLPLAGAYVTDLKNIAGASLEAYDTVLAITSYLAPLFPNITFEGWGGGKLSYSNGIDIGKLAETLPGVSQELTKYKKNFESISSKLMTIDENRYPEYLKGKPVRKYVRDIRGISSIVNKYFDDIIGALGLAPEILGMKGSKNYLIIVQNDKEMRPGGGLLGGYAFLSMENGNFKLIKSGDISFLDKEVVRARPPAPDFITQLLGTRPLYLKDANYSPDFKKSAQTIRELWFNTPQPFDLEGIVVLDTQFLKALIDTLGEIKLENGEVINSGNIEQTLDNFFLFVGNQSAVSRKYKDLTSTILNELLKKSFSYSTYNAGALLQKILRLGAAKHIMAYSSNESLQRLAEKYNLSGIVKNYDGDYLLINDAVFSPRRSNWHINQEVTKTTEIKDSQLANGLKIEFTAQPKPDSPEGVGNLHFTRIYVPKGSILIGADGASEPVSTGEDLDKTVFTALIKLEPNQKKTLTLNYTSPKPKFDNGQYKLLIQKQPGTGDFRYTVKINDQPEEFNLSEDKEISIKL